MNRYHLLLLLLIISGPATVWPASPTRVDGFTEPFRQANVGSSETGVLLGVNCELGQRVQKDEALAKLDSSVLEASLKVAMAERDGTGELEVATHRRDVMRQRLGQMQQLQQRGGATPQEVKAARDDLTQADAERETIAELRQQRRLRVEQIERQLERHTIRSPFAGVVVDRLKEIGEVVSPADPAVVRLVQLNPLKITTAIPAAASGTIRVGQQLRVKVLGEQLQGTVAFVDPAIDPQSNTVRIVATIPNKDERLPSGAPCVLYLPTDEPPQITEEPLPDPRPAAHQATLDGPYRMLARPR